MDTNHRILLIDDEPDILEIVALLLKKSGFDVTTALSGEEALKKLESESFDIAVSDFCMPKMNGIELLKILREREDYTAFIFFSGNADQTQEVEVTGLGSYGIVPKADLMNLIDFIFQTINKEQKLREIKLDKTQESKDFLKLLHSSKP